MEAINEMTILGIAGSLRKGSFNKIVLNTASELVPKNTTLDIFERLGEIPPFNQDEEDNPPDAVLELKEQIEDADAILFATPEYNYSVPGVLKNAIDWASRPYGQNAWEGKPVALMSASGGMLGGARSQYHLRQIFVFLNMKPLNRPEVIIPHVSEKISDEGKLTDPHTREKIAEILDALVKWTIKLQSGEKFVEEMKEKDEYERAYGRMMS